MDGFMLKLLKLQHREANQQWKASPTNNKMKKACGCQHWIHKGGKNTTEKILKVKKEFGLVASNPISVSTCWCTSRCYRRKTPIFRSKTKMLISEWREVLSLMLDTFNPCSVLAETWRESQQLRPRCFLLLCRFKKEEGKKKIWRHHSVG